MPKSSYHVVLDPDGGWNVKKRGAKRASKHFTNKRDAVSWGREVSRKQRSEFVIHRRDGTVQQKDYSHGGDAAPPPDRR